LSDRLPTSPFTGSPARQEPPPFAGYANPNWGDQPEPPGVPTAFIQFAHDIGIHPLIEQQHNITRWTDVDHGGHFAAMESTDELVHDLRTFFHQLR